MNTKQAYEAGQYAAANGEPITANPFTHMGDMRAAWWTNGWLHQSQGTEPADSL
jgi:hypothetical protein